MPRSASIAIHLILVGLFVIPLHYYWRSDSLSKRDERFAWRMFSPVRVERCGTRIYGDDKPVRLGEHFHNAWLGMAMRGRASVIEAMARRLCDEHDEVRVRVLCERYPGAAAGLPGRALYDPARDGSDERIEVLSAGVFNICSTGRL